MPGPQTTTIARHRCAWVPAGDPLYQRYHDREWGVPVHRDRKMFEFLVLESAQAGLSWRTVLRKRAAYRRAFAQFDWRRVARFSARDQRRLLADAGIIRNRLKIRAAINNARCFESVRTEFGTFSRYLWGFVGERSLQPHRRAIRDLPVRTFLAETIAADLKKRGFQFLGATVVYAHLQATGLINDHTRDCWRYRQLGGARKK